MLIGYVALIVITILILAVTFYAHFSGYAIPEWVLDMLGGFIGTIVAIIGSVSFQILAENRKSRIIYNKSLALLKQEIYDNFIVGLHRITNDCDTMSFFDVAYTKFATLETSIDNEKIEMHSEIAKLYFIITRGQQILKTSNAFINEVTKVQMKNPKDFQEVKDIVQSTGIDHIYEFAVLRYIILLNENYKLGIELPFNNFKKVVANCNDRAHMEDLIICYLSELICKSIFKNDRMLYYYEYIRKWRE